ncbi:MAG TPA: flagellar biosynthesis anti-sigma factor FlgM [Thermoguttaceae bacterium]|nr:flagellar biosynthesis anti-sigma factor FlgM [Thermoguttaceae bacterium]
MHIYGPAHLHGPQPVSPPHTSRASQPVSRPDSSPIQDELEISDAARLVGRAGEVPEIRQDRVDEIRARIAEGTYETREKLDIAVERLLDEIG